MENTEQEAQRLCPAILTAQPDKTAGLSRCASCRGAIGALLLAACLTYAYAAGPVHHQPLDRIAVPTRVSQLPAWTHTWLLTRIVHLQLCCSW